jgi:hypothetical protein
MYGEGSRHTSSTSEIEEESGNISAVQIHQPNSTQSPSSFTALVAAAAADAALSRSAKLHIVCI